MSSARPGESSASPSQSRRCAGCGTSRARMRCEAISAAIPIGRLMKKIQRHEAASTSQPPRIGPRIGPSSIGTPMIAMTRPTRCGPAARVRIVMPSGMIMPPPKPCRTRKTISDSALQARPGQHRADHEQDDRGHVQALGAEAVGGPAGERDDGGERERVAGRDPLDGRQRRVELLRQRLDGDVDDGDVEDRHDRAEHDHGSDEEDAAVELVVGGGSLGSRGEGSHRGPV